jgi:carbon monoxide dehydrogenase subunit G
LREVSPGVSELEYQGQGLVTGALGTLGGRFVQGVAQNLVNQGLTKFNQELHMEGVHAHR